MQKKDLLKKILQFKNGAKDRYGIIKIGVFGSYARDRMASESDVDIVVLLCDQDLFNLIGIKQELEEQLRLAVDIVSYREKMNPYLKRRIDSEAVYV